MRRRFFYIACPENPKLGPCQEGRWYFKDRNTGKVEYLGSEEKCRSRIEEILKSEEPWDPDPNGIWSND